MEKFQQKMRSGQCTPPACAFRLCGVIEEENRSDNEPTIVPKRKGA